MHTLNLRSFLWFVTGVALTVTTVATFGAWRADAAVTPGESTYVPIAPCRLFDSRPTGNVPGSNTTPLAEKESRVQQVTGSVGNCNIPAGVSGVAMNFTIVNPTSRSFLVLFPADETTLPVGSNLNWAAGQGPTPNKVDVKLSPDGKVKIYNNAGTIDILADIVGYYQSSTVSQLSADVAALQTSVAQLTAANTALQNNVIGVEVDANGTVFTSNRVTSVTKTGTGLYEVTIDRPNTSSCVPVATMFDYDLTVTIEVPTGLTYLVETRNLAAAPADGGFNIVFDCQP